MTVSTTKRDLMQMREVLKGLTDEIRVQAHLGGLELKEKWAKLEPQLMQADKVVEELSYSAIMTMHDLVRRARELRDNLHELDQGYRKVGRR